MVKWFGKVNALMWSTLFLVALLVILLVLELFHAFSLELKIQELGVVDESSSFIGLIGLNALVIKLFFMIAVVAALMFLAGLTHRFVTGVSKRDELILDEAADAIISFDAEGRIFKANKVACEMFRYSIDEMIGMRIVQLIPDLLRSAKDPLIDRPGMFKFFKNYKHNVKGRQREFSALKSNDEHFPIDLALSHIEFQGSVEFFALITDISDYQQERLKLAENEKQLRYVMDATQEGLWDWNVLSHEVKHNDRWYRFLGFEREDFCDHVDEFFDLIHPHDLPLVKQRIKDCMDGLGPYYSEHRLLGLRGKYLWVRDRGDVVERDAQGRAIRMVGSFADINERKQAEIELEEARIRAEAGSIAKSNFLANMSHEFRTPLNAIMGMTDLTLMHPTDEKQKEYLAQVKESGHELLELINNVLEFANIDLGVYKPKKEPFKLQMLFDHVEGLTRDLAERKGLCIQYHYFDQSPGTLERWVVGDADCLQKVLVKLLTNAIKFTEKGHVDLHVREVPYLDKTRLYFSVSDTGIGISEADQQKLFKLFTQVDDSSTRPFGGLGLGLVTAQKLVNLMGGEITVISDVDCGAEFSFDLNLTFIEAEEVDMYWLEQSLDKSMSLDNGVASIILPKKQGEVVEKMTALEHLNVLIDKLKSSEAESVDYWFDHQASWLTLFGQSMRNEFESLILAYEFDKVLAKIK